MRSVCGGRVGGAHEACESGSTAGAGPRRRDHRRRRRVGRRFSPDPQSIYERWDEFRTWPAPSTPTGPLDETKLLAPVPRPRQVFAIGINYAGHAAEAGLDLPEFPPTFTKFPTCLTGPYATVDLPSGFVDWEVELVLVVGRQAYEVAEGDGWSHIAGVTVGQDLSDGSCRPDLPRRSSPRQPSPASAQPGLGDLPDGSRNRMTSSSAPP